VTEEVGGGPGDAAGAGAAAGDGTVRRVSLAARARTGRGATGRAGRRRPGRLAGGGSKVALRVDGGQLRGWGPRGVGDEAYAKELALGCGRLALGGTGGERGSPNDPHQGTQIALDP